MLKISLRSDPAKLVAALRSKPEAIVNALKGRLDAVMNMVASYIVRNKLSGQTLARRTGILAGSVRTVPAHVAGRTIQAAIQAGGGPALYAKFFEEPGVGGTGGTRAHTIMATRARALAFVTNGKQVFAKSVFHPEMAARPFLRPSLLENEASIRQQLQQAIDEALQE